MPPIPIYTDAPITAAKADGITPRTAYIPTPTSNTSDQTVASGGYPAAKPGAPAVPAPTGSVTAPPRLSPTRTAQASLPQDNPPPPQPGATPVAPTTSRYSPTTGAAAPAPPQPLPGSSAMPMPMPMPPQLSIPPPPTNLAPTHSTSHASPTSPMKPQTTIPLGAVPPPPSSQYAAPAAPGMSLSPRHSVEHPHGYVQNPYAAELSAAQRASLEAQENAERRHRSRGSITSLLGVGDSGAAAGSEFGGSGAGGAGGEGGGGGGGENGAGGGVWSTVKGFASVAGQKAVEMEEAAWRRVNGK